MTHYDQFLPGEAGNLLDLTQNVSMPKSKFALHTFVFITHWICLFTTHSWELHESLFYGNVFVALLPAAFCSVCFSFVLLSKVECCVCFALLLVLLFLLLVMLKDEKSSGSNEGKRMRVGKSIERIS